MNAKYRPVYEVNVQGQRISMLFGGCGLMLPIDDATELALDILSAVRIAKYSAEEKP